MSYGIIITRHVNSDETNRYWNLSIQCIKRIYPLIKIVIIDDNSNYSFVKADFEYKNLEIIQSEFPGRGELLPYYYYLKNKFFENALIIHDSVFIYTKINFNLLILKKTQVLPLWYFHPDNENLGERIRITNSLANSYNIINKFSSNLVLGMPDSKWYGCFGVQSFINHDFLIHLERKYKITNMVHHVHNRQDRQCLERIFGCLFYTESINKKSLLGNIMNYQKYGYTYKQHINNLKHGRLPKTIVKVWTGR
jgi:hypothetical protein